METGINRKAMTLGRDQVSEGVHTHPDIGDIKGRGRWFRLLHAEMHDQRVVALVVMGVVVVVRRLEPACRGEL